MSLLNKASLIQIPSGYKDGTLYSAKPTNGDGDFTFSRGSNLAATRVNSEGLIEKGRENLLLQSNQFDTTWVTSSASVNGGQTGYDGSNDAWLFDSTSGYIYQSGLGSVSGVHTISVYVKAGTAQGFRIRVDQATDSNYIIDLSDGSLINENDNIAYKSTSVGVGWYRIEMAFVANTISNIQFRVTDLTGATSSGTAYIQDAQLEVGLVSTDVITTTTTTAQAGILEDMPRLDYSGGATCPSLLLEPQRSNLVTQSEYFDASNWSTYFYGGASLAIDFGYLSPEGKNNAYRFSYTAGSGSNGMLLTDNFIATASVDYTLSVWMKGAVGGEKVRLCLMDTGSNGIAGTTFTLTDEWVLYTDTITNSAGTSRGFQFRMQNVIGVDNDQVVYVYGAQAELGSYATSYIPTYGGSSVTRVGEECQTTSLQSASLIGATAGTFFIEANKTDDAVWFNQRIFLTSTTQRSLLMDSSAGQIRLRTFDATSAGTSITTSGLVNGLVKYLIKWDGTTIKVFANGVLVGSSAQPSYAYTTYSTFESASFSNNEISQICFFPSALTDAECIELTTI